mmetsp:Transcript_7775/g.22535  ORF Transcript_7775/g.22535 Transcript_7775/m.22535 type:complete len:534 (+) Transcript_7775:206-1807(+)
MRSVCLIIITINCLIDEDVHVVPPETVVQLLQEFMRGRCSVGPRPVDDVDVAVADVADHQGPCRVEGVPRGSRNLALELLSQSALLSLVPLLPLVQFSLCLPVVLVLVIAVERSARAVIIITPVIIIPIVVVAVVVIGGRTVIVEVPVWIVRVVIIIVKRIIVIVIVRVIIDEVVVIVAVVDVVVGGGSPHVVIVVDEEVGITAASATVALQVELDVVEVLGDVVVGDGDDGGVVQVAELGVAQLEGGEVVGLHDALLHDVLHVRVVLVLVDLHEDLDGLVEVRLGVRAAVGLLHLDGLAVVEVPVLVLGGLHVGDDLLDRGRADGGDAGRAGAGPGGGGEVAVAIAAATAGAATGRGHVVVEVLVLAAGAAVADELQVVDVEGVHVEVGDALQLAHLVPGLAAQEGGDVLQQRHVVVQLPLQAAAVADLRRRGGVQRGTGEHAVERVAQVLVELVGVVVGVHEGRLEGGDGHGVGDVQRGGVDGDGQRPVQGLGAHAARRGVGGGLAGQQRENRRGGQQRRCHGRSHHRAAM